MDASDSAGHGKVINIEGITIDKTLSFGIFMCGSNTGTESITI